MTYIIVAMVLSTVAMGLASRSALIGRVSWAAVAVALVSVVAGARDLDVTPDMLLYGNGMFERVASTSSFDAAISIAGAEVQNPEVGYVWLNYVVSRLTADPHAFYFVLAAVSACVVASAIILTRAYGPTWLMWLTYLCTAYLDSFNLLRQAPALALALLGIALVLRRRYWWAALAGLLGLLFHATAVIFIPMWAAAVVIRRSKRPQRLVFWVIAIALAVAAGSSALLDAFGGALSETKYGFYLEETTHGGIALGFETLYRLVPLFLAVVIIRRNLRQHHRTRDTHAPTAPAMRRAVRSTPGGPLASLDTRTDERIALTSSTSVLFALTTLLAVELFILPVRELAFGLYRVPMYFGFIRIIGYGAIIGAVANRKLAARIAAVAFVLGYFVFMVLGRTGIEYRSAMLDTWFLG
ncbi:EpsG family protein [Microbacterium sp. MAHUQ-60]|uniref:EpsG family protein n=1 Tax=unclassified Microbacterium TaxID=2609290 RepID=UPI003607AA57